jgi:hypothetical protein
MGKSDCCERGMVDCLEQHFEAYEPQDQITVRLLLKPCKIEAGTKAFALAAQDEKPCPIASGFVDPIDQRLD